jgi:DNA-binding CsgD family transcriptional regulator/Tfp pilus assembly protein PilF
LLAQLVEKSLVHVERRGAATRYRLLETLRFYALGHLQVSGEAAVVRTRLAEAFLDLAEEAAPALHGPDQSAWLSRLEDEHDNFRAALDTAGASGEHQLALRLSLALWWFWLMRGYLDEGRQRLKAALAAAGGVAVASRAEAHYAIGRLTALSGSTAEASTEYDVGLQLAIQIDDTALTARLLNGQARIQELRDDLEGARRLGQASLAHARAIGDLGQVADALNTLGNAAWRERALDEAERAYRESLALFRQLGDRGRCANVVGNLGGVALLQGAFVQADHLFEESATGARSLGDLVTWANALCNLGTSAYRQGDRGRAERHYREALSILRQLGDWQTIGTVIANVAILASDAGKHHRAAQLFGAAKALKERAGQLYPPFDADGSGHNRAERLTCQALGKDDFARAQSDGQALTASETIALALAGADQPESKPEGPLARLTPRERQTVGLIARGLTNRQMAERLIISERTADTHVQNILAKLGCDSRKDVAALLAANP